MNHCNLCKSQAFCNHPQVDEDFEYRSKTKEKKAAFLKQNVNQNDKAKNVLEKTTELKFIFARKNLGTRNYSFWHVKTRFFFLRCTNHHCKSLMWTSLRNIRNNHCCNFQKFCCEVCRKHSLLQCVTCFLLRKLSPNISQKQRQ